MTKEQVEELVETLETLVVSILETSENSTFSKKLAHELTKQHTKKRLLEIFGGNES